LRRPLAVLAAASVVAAILIAVTLDPAEPLAVAAMIATLAVFAGALAGLIQSSPGGRRLRAQRRGDARMLRRALEVAAVCGLLLTLRVTDGLTPITGGFIVASFVAAEIILSARPGGASR